MYLLVLDFGERILIMHQYRRIYQQYNSNDCLGSAYYSGTMTKRTRTVPFFAFTNSLPEWPLENQSLAWKLFLFHSSIVQKQDRKRQTMR